MMRLRRASPTPASGILAPHQPRPARDAAHALEHGGVVSGWSRVQASAFASERDPAGWRLAALFAGMRRRPEG
jgi:hypothetical protein